MINRRLEQFLSGQFALTGQWDGPPDCVEGESKPAIIFAHGFTGNRFESRRMFARLSQRLAGQGIRTFRFDHRGCGDSEGDFLDFTADGMIEDLDAALETFLRNPGVDEKRTAVVGYSLGGLSASYLLSKRPEFLTAALWAPVATPEIIKERLATYPNFQEYEGRGFFDYMGFRVSQDYFDNVGKLNPVEWVKGYDRPILFVQGREDVVVKPEQVELYVKGRGNDNDRVIMVDNGDHFFGTADNIDMVLQESETWLVDRLTGEW